MLNYNIMNSLSLSDQIIKYVWLNWPKNHDTEMAEANE